MLKFINVGRIVFVNPACGCQSEHFCWIRNVKLNLITPDFKCKIRPTCLIMPDRTPRRGQARNPAYEYESCLLDGLIYAFLENKHDPILILQGVDVL